MRIGKTGLLKRYSDSEWLSECKRRKLKNELKEIKTPTVTVKKTILRKAINTINTTLLKKT